MRGQLAVPQGNAMRVSEQVIAAESNSGTLRLARRGERVFTLFAENDSQAFRWISTDNATDQPVDAQGIVLAVITAPGGLVAATWTSIGMRAEKMMYHPGDDASEARMLRTLNIVLMDAKSRQHRLLLVGEQATRYNEIFWNLGWSHDSRSVGFKARKRATDAHELAVVDIDDPKGFEILYEGKGITPDVTWMPNNRQLLFAMKSPGQAITSLYTLTRGQPGSLKPWDRQPKDMQIFDGDMSSDGQHLLFVSQKIPQPTEWLNVLPKAE